MQIMPMITHRTLPTFPSVRGESGVVCRARWPTAIVVSDKIQSAVDLDRLAGDIRRRIGCEEEHCVGDVVGVTFAADRRPRSRGSTRFWLCMKIVKRGVDQPGR